MNRPAPVELCHKNMRFLITHNPTDSTLSSFIEVRNINASSQNLHKLSSVRSVRSSLCHLFLSGPEALRRHHSRPGLWYHLWQSAAGERWHQCGGESAWKHTPKSFTVQHAGTGSVLLQFFQDWPFDDGAPPPSKLVDDWLSLLKRKFQEDPGCCVAVHCVAGLGRCESSLREECIQLHACIDSTDINVCLFMQGSCACCAGFDREWDEVWRCYTTHQTVRISDHPFLYFYTAKCIKHSCVFFKITIYFSNLTNLSYTIS